MKTKKTRRAPTTPPMPTTITRMAAQGDVLFRRVEALPSAAKLVEQKGPIVVAHSETGHHHSIDEASGAKFYRIEGDPLTCYLQLASDTMVVHHRPNDTHAPILLGGPGIYEVKRQREYVPGGWRRVED